MKSWTIAVTGLRRLARDRASLLFTVALPVAIILLIGLATSGLGDGRISIGLLVSDDGAISGEIADELRASDRLEVTAYDDADELAADVRRGTVAAGIVIEAGSDRALRSGEPAAVAVIADPVGGFAQAVSAVVGGIVSERGAFVQAAWFASERGPADFDESMAQAREAHELTRPISVETQTVGATDGQDDLPTGFAYTSAANLVLFVFITSLAAAQALVESRRIGITERMYSTPTPARTIVVGELGARFLIALAQAGFIVVVGAIVFGVDWGDPIGALAVVVLFSLVGTAAGTLFGTILRTPQQAGALSPVIGISMGMLAGCMWPREVMPEFMQRIGQAFPHAWAMDAWIALIGRGESAAGIATELAVLAAFVAVLLPLATWRLRRAVAAR